MAAIATVKDSNEIAFPELTPLQKLAAIQAQIEDFDKQIEHDKQIYGIKLLEKYRADRQAEYDALMEQTVPTLEFKEDKFLKALKKKGDSYNEGSLKLIRHSTTRRKVLLDKFLDTFPFEIVKRCCKIELTLADRAVGKDTMDEFVDKEVSYSYELLDMTKME